MVRVLAIDPGNIDSGWCVIDADNCSLIEFGKTENAELLRQILHTDLRYDRAVIEMVASYGMAVGAEVFETCVWIGRYIQAIADTEQCVGTAHVTLTYRREVKLHHCHDSKAKDGNIAQALVDRFAHGQPNHGKGSKAAPGFFHGFKADIWAAFALAVHYADTQADVPADG